MRTSEANYIESLRLMIDLEEAADQAHLEKCNQKKVKLHHVEDNEFYFHVEVNETINHNSCILLILLKIDSQK